MVASDLKRKAPTKIAADFSTVDIGGAMSSTVLTGDNVGETLFVMPSTALGSGDGARTQRAKEFVHNDSANDLGAAKIYFPNWLDAWGVGSEQISLTPSHADDEGLVAHIVGLDVLGRPVRLVLPLVAEGLPSISGDTLTDVRRITIHDPDTGALTALSGDLVVERGVVAKGKVPAGYYSATAELDCWLPSALDDTTTAASAATDPTGATWSRPRTLATGLAVANGGTLTAGSAQGYWLRLTILEGLPASPDIEYVRVIEGVDLG